MLLQRFVFRFMYQQDEWFPCSVYYIGAFKMCIPCNNFDIVTHKSLIVCRIYYIFFIFPFYDVMYYYLQVKISKLSVLCEDYDTLLVYNTLSKHRWY